jgi:hypothetical protein
MACYCWLYTVCGVSLLSIEDSKYNSIHELAFQIYWLGTLGGGLAGGFLHDLAFLSTSLTFRKFKTRTRRIWNRIRRRIGEKEVAEGDSKEGTSENTGDSSRTSSLQSAGAGSAGSVTVRGGVTFSGKATAAFQTGTGPAAAEKKPVKCYDGRQRCSFRATCSTSNKAEVDTDAVVRRSASYQSALEFDDSELPHVKSPAPSHIAAAIVCGRRITINGVPVSPIGDCDFGGPVKQTVVAKETGADGASCGEVNPFSIATFDSEGSLDDDSDEVEEAASASSSSYHATMIGPTDGDALSPVCNIDNAVIEQVAPCPPSSVVGESDPLAPPSIVFITSLSEPASCIHSLDVIAENASVETAHMNGGTTPPAGDGATSAAGRHLEVNSNEENQSTDQPANGVTASRNNHRRTSPPSVSPRRVSFDLTVSGAASRDNVRKADALPATDSVANDHLLARNDADVKCPSPSSSTTSNNSIYETVRPTVVDPLHQPQSVSDDAKILMAVEKVSAGKASKKVAGITDVGRKDFIAAVQKEHYTDENFTEVHQPLAGKTSPTAGKTAPTCLHDSTQVNRVAKPAPRTAAEQQNLPGEKQLSDDKKQTKQPTGEFKTSATNAPSMKTEVISQSRDVARDDADAKSVEAEVISSTISASAAAVTDGNSLLGDTSAAKVDRAPSRTKDKAKTRSVGDASFFNCDEPRGNEVTLATLTIEAGRPRLTSEQIRDVKKMIGSVDYLDDCSPLGGAMPESDDSSAEES